MRVCRCFEGAALVVPNQRFARGNRQYHAGLLWLVMVMLLLALRPAVAEDAGEVVSVVGVAEVLRNGRWQPLGAGATLAAGDVIRTAEDGRIALRLVNGSQLKMNANGQLELKQIAAEGGLAPASGAPLRNILHLQGGEVWVRGNDESLEVRSILATATIRGTEFNLAVGPGEVA
ncbi:MAG: FecR family protein, partial [Candidatus Competibacter sp.]